MVTRVHALHRAGMGVWGKGMAFESPCPGQHCRNFAHADALNRPAISLQGF
jgi:hypothetical protein